MTMESKQLCNIIEGALLAAGEPLSLARLNNLFEEDAVPAKEDVLAALEDIAAHCQERGFELKEVASGWRFQVRAETAPWVNRLWEEKPQKYSRATLETLALIAYRQPITRGDIEEIRGVAVSSHIIRSLAERDWIKVVGHRDVPGRPSLYATTRQFLDYFNLKSLDELPSLGEIRDLDEFNNLLDLDGGFREREHTDGDPDQHQESVDELANGEQEWNEWELDPTNPSEMSPEPDSNEQIPDISDPAVTASEETASEPSGSDFADDQEHRGA